jgi:hypothetical protein
LLLLIRKYQSTSHPGENKDARGVREPKTLEWGVREKVKEEKSWHTVPTASSETTARDYQPSLSL